MKTDKQLKIMERNISRMYRMHPAIIKIKKEYDSYMADVSRNTKEAYSAYIKETDAEKKAELKKVYADEVKRLTVESKEYQELIKRFTDAMARANQDALDIANKNMRSIYAENYNQVASECRRVGIKVGKG